jgi:EpsI family protein
MNRLTYRIWLAAILMACGWMSTVWIRSGYTFEVQPLTRGLESLPLELNGYVGKDAPLDERVNEILDADSTVNREYRRPDGMVVSLHASGWVRPEKIASVAPHNPKICYTNSGWKIIEERTVPFDTPAGKLPVCILFLERETERCVVGFWYQMGKSTFNTAKEARQLHRQLWGKKQWPATMKFMLQTPAQTLDSGLPRIEEFAAIVYQWSLDL